MAKHILNPSRRELLLNLMKRPSPTKQEVIWAHWLLSVALAKNGIKPAAVKKRDLR